jgi:FKBP-type peptidyl-prolyl cis-trans isomerase
MNPFNKTEAIGIFLSIAVMAVALSVLRFNSDVFVQGAVKNDTQGAVVAASQQSDKMSDAELKDALVNASTPKGNLVELVVDDVRMGAGNAVKDGDTVTVNYVGTTQGGVRFDSSYERGEPFTFTVGKGKVIEGWDKGIIGMKAGGQRILVIPASQAYGNRQVGVIPPNSPLVFEIELMKIQ